MGWLLTMPVGAADNREVDPAAYQRPDAENIRAETRRIVSDRRFVPRWSFRDWLREKISDWDLPQVGPGFAKVLIWTLLILCALVVLAILAYIAWSVLQLWQGRGGGLARGVARSRADAARTAPFDDLFEMMRRAAVRGDYSEAVSLMMTALLRWLSDRKFVQLHDSKTNGDYVREYPGTLPSREFFRNFVLAFDATMYGRDACGHRDYQALNTLFHRIRNDAGTKQ